MKKKCFSQKTVAKSKKHVMFFSASPEAMKHMKEKHNDQSSDTQRADVGCCFFQHFFNFYFASGRKFSSELLRLGHTFEEN